MTVRTLRRYGWRPSLPDHRDVIADTAGLKVAAEVDPRKQLPPVYNQGQLGSCTANAVAAAIDYDRIVNGEKPITPARLPIYFLERLIEGQPATADTGAMGRDGFKAAQKFGYWPESEVPYTDDASALAFSADPRKLPGAIKLERPYKAVRRSVTAFKQVFTNHQTIAFGFSVFESFEGEDVARSGVMPVPGPREEQLGGHEILGVGYLRSEPNYCLCRNSWGEDWGLGGYFLMPWSVILDPSMASDFRTVYRPV